MSPRREVIGDARLILGDCREILPTLGRVDAILTDPPYGIGKAEWDEDFSLDWFDAAANLSDLIGIMPGTWNLVGLPKERAGLEYKWTLSAHLVNGMTRGGFGWGNWIPCVVYRRDRTAGQPEYVRRWCRLFALWCSVNGVGRRDLDRVCGTSDMADWYLGLLPHRCRLPAHHQWAKIKSAFSVPDSFDPQWIVYQPQTDCKAFAVGAEPKPDHPSPKPLGPVQWFAETIGGKSLCDPFMGSGTAGVACAKLGRKFTGIEIEPRYFDIACRRIEAAYREPRLELPEPAPRIEQGSLLDDAFWESAP